MKLTHTCGSHECSFGKEEQAIALARVSDELRFVSDAAGKHIAFDKARAELVQDAADERAISGASRSPSPATAGDHGRSKPRGLTASTSNPFAVRRIASAP